MILNHMKLLIIQDFKYYLIIMNQMKSHLHSYLSILNNDIDCSTRSLSVLKTALSINFVSNTTFLAWATRNDGERFRNKQRARISIIYRWKAIYRMAHASSDELDD